jgi:predicted kinase
MRKWMRERLDRRKKKPSEESGKAAPPPLQPAYFDGEANEAKVQSTDADTGDAAEIPMADEPDSGPQEVGEASPAVELAEAADAGEKSKPAASRSSAGARGRGRRRGGRGRGGRGREQAVAQAFAPATAKGSIPGADIAVEDESREAASGAEESAPAAVPQAPKAVPAATPRPPKGLVVLAIGLPGSGKSSWFKRHSVVPLSSDMVRALLFDDVREQRFQDLVFSNLRSMLKARLIAKRPMNYVDATNLTPQERQHWIKLAKDYGYEVQAIFFDVPLDVCLERHQRRDRIVPEDVMRRMAAKLKPPAFEEGFAKITVVRVKKKEEEPGV